MEDTLIQTLIETYKEQGRDLSYLIKEPYFDKLSLSDKVRLIRQNAEELNNNSSSHLSTGQRNGVIRNIAEAALVGGLGTIGGAIAYNNTFKNLPLGAYLKPIGMAMGLAGTLAGANKAMDVHRSLQSKRLMKDRLEN